MGADNAAVDNIKMRAGAKLYLGHCGHQHHSPILELFYLGTECR
jgi:hypothetical protein